MERRSVGALVSEGCSDVSAAVTTQSVGEHMSGGTLPYR